MAEACSLLADEVIFAARSFISRAPLPESVRPSDNLKVRPVSRDTDAMQFASALGFIVRCLDSSLKGIG